jgi:lipopolysaccharide biosynthesis glycosyltransferase
VLVIDLEKWRDENTGERALEMALNYRDDLAFRDQDALNYVAHDRWDRLSPAWNFIEMHWGHMGWKCHGCDRAELRDAFASPKIVHFASPAKPWDSLCAHVFADRFADYLRRTSWKNRRPPPARKTHRLVFNLIGFPHSLLDRYFWFGMVSMRDGRHAQKFLRLMLTHPWTMVTFPLGQAVSLFLLKTMDRGFVKAMKAFLKRLLRPGNPPS